jgi:DNA-binding NarL/FixJ family response regulator
MFRPGTEALRGEETDAQAERVGLDAGKCPREVLAAMRAILEREGFIPTVLDREGGGARLDGEGEPAAIVLWLADSAANSASAVERQIERFGRTPVVVACASIERRELRAALAAGAAGVVVQDELERGLATCVRAARAGQVCVPRSHWREVEPSVLSVRERQVLGLVAMGYMNRQIADRLFLAESTVKSHLSSAFGKLGVRSRSEAAELMLGRERAACIGIPETGEEAGEIPLQTSWDGSVN